MKRIALALLAVVLFTGFMVPASKMAELMKAPEDLEVLVLNGNAFFNLGKEYINTPVPCRVIIKSNGYVRQDYQFPKARVSIINEGLRQTTLVNKVRISAPLQIFAQNNMFTVLVGLYLSDNPQRIFNEIRLNQTKVAYGLANDRAAYIVGNDNDQLFIDNEDTVPIMYRIAYNNNYILAVVKNYLTGAQLANNTAKIKKGSDANGTALRIEADSSTQATMTLPATVELYNGDEIVQRWEFQDAVLFHRGTDMGSLFLTPYELKRLPVSQQALSPFMLF
jgi:hypothetical protein